MKEYLYLVSFSWQTQSGCQIATDFIPFNKMEIRTKEDFHELEKHLQEVKAIYPDSPTYNLLGFYRLH